MRSICRLASAAALAAVVAVPVAAQQPAVQVDNDEITIRGCVGPADPARTPESMLVWTRGDIMLAHAMAVPGDRDTVGTTGAPGPFFYWLDDDDGDLSKHVGQLIEVTGELDDFEEGKVKITRDGAFTEIEIDLDGDDEKARVPTAWLQSGVVDPADDREREFDIVVRKIDIEDIRVVGPCPAQ